MKDYLNKVAPHEHVLEHNKALLCETHRSACMTHTMRALFLAALAGQISHHSLMPRLQ